VFQILGAETRRAREPKFRLCPLTFSFVLSAAIQYRPLSYHDIGFDERHLFCQHAYFFTLALPCECVIKVSSKHNNVTTRY